MKDLRLCCASRRSSCVFSTCLARLLAALGKWTKF